MTECVWIIGPGRAGLALGEVLHEAGVTLAFSGRAPTAPDHPLFAAGDTGARWLGTSLAPPAGVTGVLLTVPDGAVREIAAALAEAATLPSDVPVLHTSGALGAEALDALRARGHSVGAVHPLAAIPRGAGSSAALRGALFGIEAADAAARALAERIVGACGGTLLQIGPGAKPLYHAAAVFASNYVVVLLDVAERLMEAAGVETGAARAALAALASGAVANVAQRGPVPALTGPIARGDAETVRLHLARLSPEVRTVYSVLGRRALALARHGGLPTEAAARLRTALDGDAR